MIPIAEWVSAGGASYSSTRGSDAAPDDLGLIAAWKRLCGLSWARSSDTGNEQLGLTDVTQMICNVRSLRYRLPDV